MSNVISVENLGKKYLLSHQTQRQPYVALRDVIAEGTATIGRRLLHPINRLVSSASSPQPQIPASEDFWALKDVSFEITDGDRVGIIGRNGAGKSTLLKILSRITEPSAGRVRIKGRVASLLEVGTGFHPELTGRENIFLNGAILGMTKAEIKKKFDEIVDFAEIEKFLDTPVKRYSSGMYVRLAFAVAAHLEPELLLVDEVLAVGDTQFQKKCLGKMEEVSASGKTLLFVSHNMATVKSLCRKGIFLNQGSLEFFGDIDACVADYLDSRETKSASHSVVGEAGSPVRIQSICAGDGSTSRFPHDKPLVINVTVELAERLSNIYFALHIHDSSLQSLILSRDFEYDESLLGNRDEGSYRLQITVPAPLLVPGAYRLSLHVARSSPPVFLTGIDHVCPFEIFDNGSIQAKTGFPWRGVVTVPLAWQFTPSGILEDGSETGTTSS